MRWYGGRRSASPSALLDLTTLRPARRRRRCAEGRREREVLRAAEGQAAELGLTVRKCASLSTSPPPVLTGWVLVRAAARRHEVSRRKAGT